MNPEKLSVVRHREIIRMYLEDKLSCKEIGARVGACATTIHRILRTNKIKLRPSNTDMEPTEEQIAEYERRKAEITRQKDLAQQEKPEGRYRGKVKPVIKFVFGVRDFNH